MERKYFIHENLDTSKKIVKYIDDMYDYYYSNGDDDGAFFEISEEEAEELEKSENYDK